MTSLYLKYRPQKLADLDLVEVKESLGKLVKTKNIPHAFLFAGPKGTGKTSAARILAKIINCQALGKDSEPCNKCNQCTSITKGSNIDVIEMDAASNRGIDDIRELKDAVKLAPSAASKKVYIIDEAHMLTAEASNALLKTMEEPPDHVVFILATTNPEKLLTTIKSRTTFVNFSKANSEEIVESLTKKLRAEKIKNKKEVLVAIAGAADGSFRDADKIAEAAITQKQDLTNLTKLQGFLAKQFPSADTLFSFLLSKKTTDALLELDKLIQNGALASDICKALLQTARAELLARVGIGKANYEQVSKADLIDLIKLLVQASSQIEFALIEQIPLEIAIIEWCDDEQRAGGDNKLLPEDKPKKETTVDNTSFQSAEEIPSKEEVEDKSESSLSNGTHTSDVQMDVNNKEVEDGVWRQVLELVRAKNASTEALLRASKPLFIDSGQLTLGVYYKFHKEHLESNAHRLILEDILSGILGSKIKVICTLTEPAINTSVDNIQSSAVEEEVKTVLTEATDDNIVDVAEKIFGN